MDNKILLNDIEELVSRKQYYEVFENKSVLVTGSTGIIGSILVKSMIRNGKIKVYACCRSEDKFKLVFEDYVCSNLIPIYSDIMDLDISDLDIDYVVHGASITDSKSFIEKPVETIEIALEGTKKLLKQCTDKNLMGFVYLSSLEVYGTFNNYDGIKNVKENEAGYIDSMAVRSSYSEGKRMVENMCKAFQSEYNVPIKVCRLCQTFGAGVEYTDNRVFAQFARAVIEGRDIILKTKGETVRNYCYTIDAVSGILSVLSKGNIGEAYNIANMETTISIADMAVMFCKLSPEYKSKVVFDIVEDVGNLGYNPVVKIELNSSKLKQLGWQPLYNLQEMITRLISYFEIVKE